MSQKKEVSQDTLREDILHSEENCLGINTQPESESTGTKGTETIRITTAKFEGEFKKLT
jgi:hypothetical protein